MNAGDGRKDIMTSIQDLQNIYAGKPGAVLGGGPSLPGDVERLPEGCVLISVNQHALRLVQADYLVFLDDPLKSLEVQDVLREFQGVKVSRCSGWGNVQIGGECPRWNGQYSGHVAAWLADWMGCDPILLCGMDLYQGKDDYFYRPGRHRRGPSLERALRGWKKLKDGTPHPERMRAISGPLVGVFEGWGE
jgi:hypothetical protein